MAHELLRYVGVIGLRAQKDWDAYVVHAEEVARSPGFRDLRDRILTLAQPGPQTTAVDLGAGTGLLTLALAREGASVWALDISAEMCAYLSAKAESARLERVRVVRGSAVSVPLVDSCADLVVSNYCFHHLSSEEKLCALSEAHRVLRPGGRLIFADMMFSPSLGTPRDRRLLRQKTGAMLRRGPGGLLRLTKNAARVLTGRWEQPARADWWRRALDEAGFCEVVVEELPHEGGIAIATAA